MISMYLNCQQLKMTIEKDKKEIKKIVRKTQEGKEKELENKALTDKNKLLQQANRKNSDSSEWESVEEDAPIVKLEEILGKL